jgi:hypothetical protein
MEKSRRRIPLLTLGRAALRRHVLRTQYIILVLLHGRAHGRAGGRLCKFKCVAKFPIKSLTLQPRNSLLFLAAQWTLGGGALVRRNFRLTPRDTSLKLTNRNYGGLLDCNNSTTVPPGAYWFIGADRTLALAKSADVYGEIHFDVRVWRPRP